MPKTQNPKWLYHPTTKHKIGPNPNYNPKLDRNNQPQSQSSLESKNQPQNESQPLELPASNVVGSPPVEHKPGAAEKEYRDFLLQTLGVTSLVLAMLLCYLMSFKM